MTHHQIDLPVVANRRCQEREREEETDGGKRWFGWLRLPRLGPGGGVGSGGLGFVFEIVNVVGFVRFVDLCLKLLNDFLDRGFVRLFSPFILFLELIEEDEICGFYFCDFLLELIEEEGRRYELLNEICGFFFGN